MGIHYPFRYVGYEATCLHTFIDLLDNFCSGCHTNDDVGNDCKACPVGQLVHKSKDYLLKAYESDTLKRETKILKEIKKEIKNIEPSPFFNSNFIFNEKRKRDVLLELRELLKDLVFVNEQRVGPFRLERDIEKKTFSRIASKVDKEMKKNFERGSKSHS